MTSGGALPLIFLHTRAFRTYLLGGAGVMAQSLKPTPRNIYLAKSIIRWWYFTCKEPENIIRDGILHVNMFLYFKIPYIACTFLTKFTYNEYIGPYFLLHVISKNIALNNPSKSNPKLKMKTSLEVLNINYPPQEATSVGHCHYKKWSQMVNSQFLTSYWKHVPYNSCTSLIWVLCFIS